MSEKVTIRLFRPDDLPPLTELERRVYGSGAYSFYFFRQLYDLFPTLVWVAETDKMLVGHICGGIEHSGTVGWLLNFAVLAHWRRQGVGQQLLARCMAQLAQEGVQRIRTTIEAENHTACRLLKRLGFVEQEIVENYYGDGIDRLVMEYRVPQAPPDQT